MDKKFYKKIIKAVVWSVALQCVWKRGQRGKMEIDRLQAFEMWMWSKMEKISWKDKMTMNRY